MTTIDAAAARHVPKLVATAVLVATLALGATGCSTGGGSNVLSTFGVQSTNNSTPPTAAAAATKGTVSIAPIIGPPDNVSGQLSQQLTASLQKSGIQVVGAKSGTAAASAAKSDYTLRGYIVAAREAKGTKVSYIWDVTNPGGQRVNRITGEELANGAASADPWSSVSAPVMQQIAAKTASSLSAWMPKKSAPKVAPAATPVASATPKPAPVQTAAAGTAPAARPATTASIPKSASLTVVVPRVSGAPGDGPTALARALQAELRRKGIPLAGAGANPPSAHRVEGIVVMGASNGGKQPISIDWVVKDPGGAKLGTVSQKNEIPAGSLNSKWGPTAGAAAAAAAEGIVRLLPKKT